MKDTKKTATEAKVKENREHSQESRKSQADVEETLVPQREQNRGK